MGKTVFDKYFKKQSKSNFSSEVHQDPHLKEILSDHDAVQRKRALREMASKNLSKITYLSMFAFSVTYDTTFLIKMKEFPPFFLDTENVMQNGIILSGVVEEEKIEFPYLNEGSSVSASTFYGSCVRNSWQFEQVDPPTTEDNSSSVVRCNDLVYIKLQSIYSQKTTQYLYLFANADVAKDAVAQNHKLTVHLTTNPSSKCIWRIIDQDEFTRHDKEPSVVKPMQKLAFEHFDTGVWLAIDYRGRKRTIFGDEFIVTLYTVKQLKDYMQGLYVFSVHFGLPVEIQLYEEEETAIIFPLV